MRIVHVAGTNGKGSTCAMIASALQAGGQRTGLFTSPHLAEPTERIQIDGAPVSAEIFAAAFDRVHAAVERLLADGRIDLHTTYFETVTAMALVIFAGDLGPTSRVGQDSTPQDLCEPVDIAVLEVGLGGRLDATNVVEPELCVITPVDFDHEMYLGRSLEAIATEKAGILKAGVPAVFAVQRPEAAAVLDTRAHQLTVRVARTEAWRIQDLEMDARGSRFHLSGELELSIVCPLAGEHQVENARTAAVALTRFGVSTTAITAGIASAHWPGRLERASESPEIILDGAHNPAGARALAAYIAQFYGGRRITMIYGAMRDKAIDEIAGILFPLAERVIVTAPRQARALAPEAIRQVASHANLQTAATLEEALEAARDAVSAEGGHATPVGATAAPGVIFVTGSLFLVAEARALLGLA